MAGNGGGGGGAGAASIVAAAAAAGTSEGRFPAPLERRSRWGGCLSLFACYGSQKKAKRIVPSSRIPDGTLAANRGNASQASGLPNQAVTLILAPPSSPASFTNSALPSTAQSPNCFLSMSANSPGEFSNPMYVTGPYAHETQLVSPPVFSTYTTEPSTAPLTPPPELAHLTTPSSPDVPYAQYLSSSLDIKTKHNGVPYISTGYGATNDLQATYALYPGSPASSLISPISGTPRTGMSSPFPERDVPTRWGSLSSHDSRNRSPKDSGVNTPTSKNFMLPPNSSFFYTASSAQFHLDQAQQSYSSSCGARLSISRETDHHSSVGGQHSKARKQDVEEVVEAYRASFGFSADEIMTTPHYVEISDPVDISFNVPQLPSSNLSSTEHTPASATAEKGHREAAWPAFMGFRNPNFLSQQHTNGATDNRHTEQGHRLSLSPRELPNGNSDASPVELPAIKTRDTRGSRSFRMGLSVSDAEIDYRRSRSLKHGSMTL